jgi:hypothetical protein
VVAANDKVAVGFMLSGGEAGDGPIGRELPGRIGHTEEPVALLMDRAYEGDETRALAISLGYIPVVPPKKNRKNPLELRLVFCSCQSPNFGLRYKAFSLTNYGHFPPPSAAKTITAMKLARMNVCFA